MPVQLDLPSDPRSISLAEFVEEIAERRPKLDTFEGLVEAARPLQRLNNNKTFLIEEMARDLASGSSFQKANIYGPQVFILHVAAEYFLRANIWQPITQIENDIPGFRYDICHDHNFDILTAGYFGPGYVSRTYEYDPHPVSGLLGEDVDLRDTGDFQLNDGRIAIYRAKRDIHIQLPPASISVSLNLIPKSKSLRNPQFQFDESNSRICRYLQASGAELATRLSGILGDCRHVDALQTIIQSDPAAHVRAHAIVALHRLRGEQPLPLDASIAIKDIVRSELKRYGTCLSLYREGDREKVSQTDQSSILDPLPI